MKKKHVNKNKNLCMITTIYALFEWLLYASEKEIKDTFYVFENWIPSSITSQFAHKFVMPKFIKKYMSDERLSWMWFRYIKFRYLPNLNDYNLIAHDHMPYSAVFIGKKKYTMLEDGPKIFSEKAVNRWVNKYKDRHSLPKKWIIKILRGPTAGLPMGVNSQCTDLIVSSMDISPQLKDKNIHYINIFEAWTHASDEKKKFILDVFGITESLFHQIKDREIVYFSGAHCDNGVLSEDEYRQLYKKLLSKYNTENLVIKPHPRDYCNSYVVDFPNVTVLPSYIPSQLLDMIGIHFKKAITLDSSSVFELGYSLNIDWYGRECHPKIFKKYGQGIIPDGVNHCTLD